MQYHTLDRIRKSHRPELRPCFWRIPTLTSTFSHLALQMTRINISKKQASSWTDHWTIGTKYARFMLVNLIIACTGCLVHLYLLVSNRFHGTPKDVFVYLVWMPLVFVTLTAWHWVAKPWYLWWNDTTNGRNAQISARNLENGLEIYRESSGRSQLLYCSRVQFFLDDNSPSQRYYLAEAQAIAFDVGLHVEMYAFTAWWISLYFFLLLMTFSLELCPYLFDISVD